VVCVFAGSRAGSAQGSAGARVTITGAVTIVERADEPGPVHRATEDLVDTARRQYSGAEMLTMITINRESNRALGLVAKAMQDSDAGKNAEAQKEVGEALTALDAIQRSMKSAEYGKWVNWYRGDWLTGVYRTRELIAAYGDHLKDPMAKLPPPVGWTGWEAYFHIMEYEGDRSVDVH
jgi:hypothetical protein